MKLERNRVAVVTGAASGIGLATSAACGQRGLRVALADVDEPALEDAAEAVLAAGAAAVSTHVCDVSQSAAVDALRDAVVREHGAAHLLVNNAGVAVMKTIEQTTAQDWEWIVGINFWGVVHGCRSFLPVLREQSEAHIVNVSSVFGFLGAPSQGAYCATKFAVRGFSESLWAELRDTSVGVTSVHPGAIQTNIVRSGRTDDEAERSENQARFDRFGHPPEQVARAILRGVERRKLRVLVGVEAYALDWLKRLAPVSMHRLVAARVGSGN